MNGEPLPPPTGRLEARADLVFVEDDDRGGVIVKDPLTLEYFRLGEREAFLLAELRAPLSLRDLHRRYAERFPDERASPDEVLRFCSVLNDCSLLAGDGGQRPASKRAAAWFNPLAIRLPSIDPSPLLRRLDGLGRAAFSRAFACVFVAAAVGVGVALLGRAEEALGAVSDLAALTDPRHALLGLLVVAAAKAWHELGHALACRRFGGECHEAGVLLLAFFPCLYCDVTDAWTFRRRRQRVVVALAGVYFELLLAVGAAAAWLVLAPGVARTLALYTVLITSLTSLLVNLNPLVRFDGYYLLADVWGVANLHQQSRRALWGPLTDWVAGRPRHAEPLDAPRPLLAAFGLASTAYQVVLLAVILWGVHAWLASVGFRAVGDVLVAAALLGVGAAWARAAWSSLAPPAPRGRFAAAGRFAVLAGVFALAAWAALGVSVEQSLKSPCRLESAPWVALAAPVAGELRAAARYGDRVARGQTIAELRDPDAELRRLELLEEIARAESRIAGMRRRAPRDPALLDEIARLETERGELRRQLRTHDALEARRVIRAPFDGRLERPADRPDPDPGVRLASWTGAPLQPANAGCAVEAGEELCLVAGGGLRAVVLLDQHSSGLVQVGDPVRVILDRDPERPIGGRVSAVALAASDDAGARPTATTDVAVERSMRDPLRGEASYRIAVTLDTPGPAAQPGALGQARVVTGRETVLAWCVRWFSRTVRFQ